MKLPILSVILPIYNGNDTINRCIDSIISQSFKDFELICIDDGSDDKSYTICEQYAEKDERIRLFKKTNGGAPSARKMAMKKIVGKYVTFVDQDDFIESDMYLDMTNAIESEDADMVVCGYSKDYGDRVEKMGNLEEIPEIITDINDYIKFAFYREHYRNYAAFLWNKMFSTEVINNNGITIDENMMIGDDVSFYTEYALASMKCVYIGGNYYHYSRNNVNAVSMSNTFKAYTIRLDILKGYRKAIKLLDDSVSVKRDTVDYLKCFYTYHASNLYEKAREYGLLKEQEYLKGEIIRYLKEYEKQNAFDETRIQRVISIINKES